MIALSILIPTLQERAASLELLVDEIEAQLKQSLFASGEVEVLFDGAARGAKTIGAKRNDLLRKAKGKYIAFIDDDDMIGPEYINLAFETYIHTFDCCKLNGIITFDGKAPREFIHSIEYDHYFEKDQVYYRCPNHLNFIKRELVQDIPFPENNFGEDTEWALAVRDAKVLRTELMHSETIYYYQY